MLARGTMSDSDGWEQPRVIFVRRVWMLSFSLFLLPSFPRPANSTNAVLIWPGWDLSETAAPQFARRGKDLTFSAALVRINNMKNPSQSRRTPDPLPGVRHDRPGLPRCALAEAAEIDRPLAVLLGPSSFAFTPKCQFEGGPAGTRQMRPTSRMKDKDSRECGKMRGADGRWGGRLSYQGLT